MKANEALVHDFPRVMFVLMPVFSLLTWVCYRGRRPFYAAHLYYSIHFHAFVFLVLTVVVALRALPIPNSVTTVLTIGIPVYLRKSLERVFGGSTWAKVWKGVSVLLVYAVIVTASLRAIMNWAAGIA